MNIETQIIYLRDKVIQLFILYNSVLCLSSILLCLCVCVLPSLANKRIHSFDSDSRPYKLR